MNMSRAQSVTSGEANDGAVEVEFTKLQRTFRAMESERKAYADESRILIKKQRSAIDKLRRDNEYMLQELTLFQRRIEDTKRNGPGSEKAELLHQKAEQYHVRMRAAAHDISALDAEMDGIHRAMAEHRRSMGGVNAALTNSMAIEKQVKVLENRLDQALVKYNRALANNKRLRSGIDNLRRERLVFDNVYSKFEMELANEKKAMAEIIEGSNSAYEARDEAQAKIVLLSEKSEKEYQAYIQEIKELDRTLEQDRKLKDFLATKAADRLAESTVGMGDLRKTKQLSKTSSSSQDFLNASVASYEKVLSHIQEVTGVGSLDELVQRFKDVEDQNFSLFNYVNQVNNEGEKVGEELARVHRQMDSLDKENRADEVERKKKLAILEHQLSDTRTKTTAMESRNGEVQHSIQRLYDGVQGLVSSLRSSDVTVTSITPASSEDVEETGSGNSGSAASPVVTSTPAAATVIVSPTASAVAATNAAAGDAATGGSSAALSPPAPTSSTSGGGPTSIPAVTSHPLKIPEIHLPAGATTSEALLAHLAAVEERINDLIILHQLVTNPRAKLASAGGAGGSAAGGGAAGGAGNGASGNGATGSAPGSAAPTMDGRDPGAAGTAAAYLRGPAAIVVSIQAPNTGDNDSSDEDFDDDRPLSRSELATKSLRGLTRRLQNGGGSSKKRRGRRLGGERKD